MEFKEVQSLGNVGLVCKQADCLTCFYCKVHISVWSGGDEKSVAHSQFRACPNAVFSFQKTVLLQKIDACTDGSDTGFVPVKAVKEGA